MNKAELDCATYAGVVSGKLRERGATVDNLQRLADKILTIPVNSEHEEADLKSEVREIILKLRNKVERGETLEHGDWTSVADKIEAWKGTLRKRSKVRG